MFFFLFILSLVCELNIMKITFGELIIHNFNMCYHFDPTELTFDHDFLLHRS